MAWCHMHATHALPKQPHARLCHCAGLFTCWHTAGPSAVHAASFTSLFYFSRCNRQATHDPTRQPQTSKHATAVNAPSDWTLSQQQPLTSTASIPNGSSICTPISSIPKSRNDTTILIGTLNHPSSCQMTKGRQVSQSTRNRPVCLQGAAAATDSLTIKSRQL